MKWHRLQAWITALFLFSSIALCACSAQLLEETDTTTVRVIATQNFGQELIFDETVAIDADTCALEALTQVASVEQAYGGGFVTAINGICSEYTSDPPVQKDWFFYINGMQGNTGALDYILQPGDIEHWDFHDWGFQTLIPATTGNLPEPFRHGYNGAVHPTIITYQNGWEEEAQDIAGRLSQLGIDNASTKSISELSKQEKESANLLILGTMDCQLILEMNQVWRQLGFYAYFEDDRLVILNQKGEVAAEYEAGAGLLQATQSPWNQKGTLACENVVWMVSGTDEVGIKSAVDVLINQYDKFQYAYAAVIAQGVIIKIPL